MIHPQTVKDEVEKLLAEMREKVLTIDDLRTSIEIAAIARRAHIPEATPDFIPAVARATLLGAWVEYDIRRRGYSGAA